LGRVASVGGLIAWGVLPLGSIAGGALIEATGPTPTLLLLSGLMFAVAILATLNRSLHVSVEVRTSVR
jgi:hypothetical protein